MNEEIKNNITEFEVDALVLSSFNKIARWHNEDPTRTALKQLSLELVEDIAGAVIEHFGLTYNFAIAMDDKLRSEVDNKKKEENMLGYRSLDEMSIEEIKIELERRMKKD